MLKTCVIQLRKWIVLYVLLGFALQFFGAYGVHTFQRLLDSVPSSSGLGQIGPLLLFYGALLAICAVLSYVSEYPQTALPRSLFEKLEPVSALDNITERQIMETVLDRFRGRTLIVVAHRLHAIRRVDCILLMRGGELFDQGRFDELLERSDYFRELWSKDGAENDADGRAS